MLIYPVLHSEKQDISYVNFCQVFSAFFHFNNFCFSLLHFYIFYFCIFIVYLHILTFIYIIFIFHSFFSCFCKFGVTTAPPTSQRSVYRDWEKLYSAKSQMYWVKCIICFKISANHAKCCIKQLTCPIYRFPIKSETWQVSKQILDDIFSVTLW